MEKKEILKDEDFVLNEESINPPSYEEYIKEMYISFKKY